MSSRKVTLSFDTSVGGKWILTGEHAVLHGAHSVALPLPDLQLRLRARKRVRSSGPTLDRALEGLRRRLYDRTGIDLDDYLLEIDNNVPISAGLGSSASLSVAMSRFAKWVKPGMHISELHLAQELENEFHGRSSGMDIAVVEKNKPILFKNGKVVDSFSMKQSAESMEHYAKQGEKQSPKRGAKQSAGPGAFSGSDVLPLFTLHWSGRPKSTRDAVQRVQEWMAIHPDKAKRRIRQMDEASCRVWKALLLLYGSDSHLHESRTNKDSVKKLKERRALASAMQNISSAMQESHECFEEWGLVPSDLIAQRRELLARGAKAVKLTGAGLGGYWVAFWGEQTLQTNPLQMNPEDVTRKRQILIDRPLAGL